MRKQTVDYGRALMVKAGYSGSGLNDVIWMGDVVNQACHLANRANRNGRKAMLYGSIFYQNLNDANKALCSQYYDYNDAEYYYEANIVNTNMNDWYQENCK